MVDLMLSSTVADNAVTAPTATMQAAAAKTAVQTASPAAATVGIDLTWIMAGAAGLLLIVVIVLAAMLAKAKRREMHKEPMAEALTAIGPLTVGKLHRQGGRKNQQDCFAVSPEELADSHGLLAVVADGMGGLADGEKVSQTVVATMLDSFFSAQGEPDHVLLTLLGQANSAVNRMLGPSRIGKSGSTLAAGVVRDGRFYYISVGDSRICLYRNGALRQLNREHIYRHELAIDALNGVGTLSGAYDHPNSGGLTSFIGMGRLKYVDIPAEPMPLIPGDKLILMSDGVYNALTEQELEDAMAFPPEQCAEELHRLIDEKAYANQDNYTAVVIAC